MADSETPSYIDDDPAYLSETYNKDHRMAINLTEMYDAGHVRIDFLLDTLRDLWIGAMTTWNDLLLDWSGSGADASKELQAKIEAVGTKLLGKPSASDPEVADPAGILAHMKTLVGAARLDLDQAESSVRNSFAKLSEDMNRAAGGTESIWFDVDKDGKGDLALPAGKQAPDVSGGPITETFSHPIDRGHTEGKRVDAPTYEDQHKEYKTPEQIQTEQLREIGEQRRHGPYGPK